MTILTAAQDDHGRRLDRVLRKALPELPLSLIHRLLREGKVLVDRRPRDGGFRISAGEEISLPAGGGRAGEKREAGTAPALRIIYEDADFLVLNKEAGLPVHGGGDSLEALARAYLAAKLAPSLSFRPGPLHRLDRPTSGILVFSASLEGARRFSALLREGGIRKHYLALAEGCLEGPGIWEDRLLRDREDRRTVLSAEGKSARTRYSALRPAGGGGTGAYTLLVLEPETGRTHQIRAQAAAHGHPLGGDSKYGGGPLPGTRPGAPFLLHAWKLSCPLHPPLEAPPPDYFLAAAGKILGKELIRNLPAGPQT
jgi:23S rRNA pseudouridine955/2504/2580 synthase